MEQVSQQCWEKMRESDTDNLNQKKNTHTFMKPTTNQMCLQNREMCVHAMWMLCTGRYKERGALAELIKLHCVLYAIVSQSVLKMCCISWLSKKKKHSACLFCSTCLQTVANKLNFTAIHSHTYSNMINDLFNRLFVILHGNA